VHSGGKPVAFGVGEAEVTIVALGFEYLVFLVQAGDDVLLSAVDSARKYEAQEMEEHGITPVSPGRW
jgi:hypothetical protein